MIFTTCGRGAERAQQAIDLFLVARDERPAWSGFELRAPRFQTFRRVSQRVHADGNKIYVFADLLAQLTLHARKGRTQRRADRRAISEDKVDSDGLAFDQVTVEVSNVAVLVQHLDIRNVEALAGFRHNILGCLRSRANRRSSFLDEVHLALRTLPTLL